VDLSITELCNRSGGSPKSCAFCPRIDPAFYPNQKLHMPVALAAKIGDELRALRYAGAIVLCGFGEPLLHPQVVDVVRALSGLRVEIVTNGDRLSVGLIRDLVEAGTAYFAVSLYDGPYQAGPTRALFAEAGCGTDRYVLRDRWHGPGDDFGLKLTNRAGSVSIGHQPAVDTARPCHYPAYQLTVDWNGDVLLCVQDWHKRVRYGNAAGQSLMDIWTSPAMHKRRMALLAGRRDAAPCSGCNADGTLHGADHAAAWRSPR
jgi:radical SAM protein with 4Fe4S-binding SPASM domain